MGPRVIPIPSGAARCCGSRLLRLGTGSPWRRRVHSYAGPSAGQIRLVNVERDVLKVLYESVISASTRKALGEYYTPDWLANAMVSQQI
jgi:hypothetical protein